MSKLVGGSPLGTFLVNTLDDLGWSVETLAAIVGVSRPTIYDWIKDKHPNPRSEYRQALADAFGIETSIIDELVFVGMGYQFSRTPERVQGLARIIARLDQYDLDEIEAIATQRLIRYQRARGPRRKR